MSIYPDNISKQEQEAWEEGAYKRGLIKLNGSGCSMRPMVLQHDIDGLSTKDNHPITCFIVDESDITESLLNAFEDIKNGRIVRVTNEKLNEFLKELL